MAVDEGCRLEQADYKNDFCNGIVPEDEICIVKPPANCPRSTRGTFWKLNKTLYGLTCSAHHWYTKILNHLVDDLGFTAMDQDKCVYKCTLIKGQSQSTSVCTLTTSFIILHLIKWKNGSKMD